MLNIMDCLKPMDIICFGLTGKGIWQSAKAHLESQGLYPARVVLTDIWGRYSARPLAYHDLPERLESWMSPRVLFHQSISRTFVKNQARADRMLVYFQMVQEELGRSWRLPECIPVLEFSRPDWVLPHCRGFFEKWQHMDVHDTKTCTICCAMVRRLALLSRPKQSTIANPEAINPLVQSMATSAMGRSVKMQALLYLKSRELVARRIERGWRWREFDGNGLKSAVIRGTMS
jgi:hypothetical protein